MKLLKLNKKTRFLFVAYCVMVVCFCFATPVHAGVVQVGLSLKSHDPSQRANGFLTVAGGIVITFAKEILNIIVGG